MNAIIESVLEKSEVDMIWELETEDEAVKIDKEIMSKLGVKEGKSIYLLKYGDRIFIFKDKEDAERFAKKLREAGAEISEEEIREIENEGEVLLKEEDIKELGDLSKGVRLEYREKERATEIKAIAEEEKKEKETEITEEKIEKSKERIEKEMIRKYRLNVANFRLNEYTLTTKAKKAIAKEANEIRKYDYEKITIEGHTCWLGGDKVNERLSRLRAETVYKEFLLNGIPAEKITYIGYSSKVPIAPNTTKEGRAANRRTEIYVE
jgi:outer membrane protein OmpA-like peptidoglycan-associated protein